jgi:signal peptidase I
MKYLIDNLKSLLIAIILAVTFRSVLYEPWLIPSGSMIPTLLVGDRIFISKWEYGISNFSFPFEPNLFKGRVLEFSKPERGDVIVFKQKKGDEYITYIKRLIGLPGDVVQMVGGVLYINDKPVPKLETDPFDLNGKTTPQFIETLPNGVSYHTLDMYDSQMDNTQKYVVPENNYFFMGDNRDGSADSRYLNGIGFVPAENLLGKAKFIFFSTSAEWYDVVGWVTKLRYSRLFKAVD